MPKFFLSDCSFEVSDTVSITGDDAHHISKTLRMKVGDRLVVTGSNSVDYDCIIESFTEDSVELKVEDIRQSTVEDAHRITLFQALVKGDKMDTVVQKSVELGVYDIYPVAAERSVVKLDAKGAAKKVERWNKIALEASKQCGRGIIPKVHDVITFKECAEKMAELDIGFFCYELSDGKTVKDVIRDKDFTTLGFYIGPEGGVSPSEADYAKSLGIEDITLGKLILRTETAGPAVMAMLLYEIRL